MSHLNNPITPSGAYIERREDTRPTFTDSLFHEVLSASNLKRAWKQVRANKGAAGVMEKERVLPSTEGVPQGGPLSPLLSNILLDSLDQELELRGRYFARYADDFIILVKSQRAGERVLVSVSRFLETRLKLVVNTKKSHVGKVTQSKFLGFTFTRGHIQWHPKTLRGFKQQARTLTNSNWGVSTRYQLFKLRQYLTGWINYFGIANAY